MEKKENENMTIRKFIEIVENIIRHYSNRVIYVRMTDEFYNHLFVQTEQISGASLNHILGITIIKVQNGKLRSMPKMGLDDWEIEYGVTWA